jgi:peptide/nickel transport system permease protein
MSAAGSPQVVPLPAARGGAQSPFRRIVADFVANPVAIFGLALLAIILVLALFAPLISPQNPYDLAQLDVMDSRLPPGSASPNGGTFWLGTDDQGRDMLSAISTACGSASAWGSPRRCWRSPSG